MSSLTECQFRRMRILHPESRILYKPPFLKVKVSVSQGLSRRILQKPENFPTASNRMELPLKSLPFTFLALTTQSVPVLFAKATVGPSALMKTLWFLTNHYPFSVMPWFAGKEKKWENGRISWSSMQPNLIFRFTNLISSFQQLKKDCFGLATAILKD